MLLRLTSALLALAVPAALAQQQWADWNAGPSNALATGTVAGVPISLAVNPTGNPGLRITGQSGSSNLWNNVTNYGPNPPATARCVHED